MEKPIIALMYDFDKTLCTKDMQEYSFIPQLDMEPQEFWSEVTKLALKENMDRILAYMYHMIFSAHKKGVPIKRKDFEKAGKSVELFPGVEGWFKRINALGESLGLQVEHYIISSGLKEIITGMSIKGEFKKIYACEFHYNENGEVDWPAMTVNYTNKTQFLFRINKGVLDVFEDEQLNEYLEDRDRRVPFRNMIYIGDGLTDVPCMKLVKINGGQSIAVYTNKEKVAGLLKNQRVDYIVPADYQKSSKLDYLVELILKKMAAENELVDINHSQSDYVE